MEKDHYTLVVRIREGRYQHRSLSFSELEAWLRNWLQTPEEKSPMFYVEPHEPGKAYYVGISDEMYAQTLNRV